MFLYFSYLLSYASSIIYCYLFRSRHLLSIISDIIFIIIMIIIIFIAVFVIFSSGKKLEMFHKNWILPKFYIENANAKIRTNYPFVELDYLISVIFTCSFFIEFWKRTQSTIAMKWGVEGTYVLTHFKFDYIY